MLLVIFTKIHHGTYVYMYVCVVCIQQCSQEAMDCTICYPVCHNHFPVPPAKSKPAGGLFEDDDSIFSSPPGTAKVQMQ